MIPHGGEFWETDLEFWSLGSPDRQGSKGGDTKDSWHMEKTQPEMQAQESWPGLSTQDWKNGGTEFAANLALPWDPGTLNAQIGN
jgi:hypothetical protein